MSFDATVAGFALYALILLLTLACGYYWGLYTALKMAITGKYGNMHITKDEKKKWI